MPSLSELYFLEASVASDTFREIASNLDSDIHGVFGNRQLAENAVIELFESRGFLVGNIDQRRKSPIRHALGIGQFHEKFPDVEPDIPANLPQVIRSKIREHEDIGADDGPLDLIDIPGIPDLVISDIGCSEWFFAEVKYEEENLLVNQRDWFNRFDYFDNRIIVVFHDEQQMDRYASTTSVSKMLSKAVSGSWHDEVEEREGMDPREMANILQSVEVGDQLVFNDKIEPLKVIETDKTMTGKATLTGVELESQQGKSYLLSYDGESYLDPWNKRSLDWLGYGK